MSKIFTLSGSIACALFTFFLELAEAKIEYERAWVDIPDFSRISTPFSNADWFEEVAVAVKSYHEIDKTCIENIPLRASALRNIKTMLSNISPPSDSISIQEKLKLLAKMASNKAWYLDQLQHLYTNVGKSESQIKSYFEPCSDKSDSRELVLVNKVFYDFKLPTAWGLYWLEVLDPCHRLTLTPYYLKWSKEKVNSPFFLWLETEEVPFYTTQIDYLTQEELLKYRTVISSEDRLLYDSEGKKANFTSPDKEYIYVLSSANELIVVEGNEVIRHASLSLGKPVIGTGSLKVDNGELTYIDVESGHYQPSPEALLNTIQTLEKLGLKIDPNIIQSKYYTDKGDIIKILLSDFMKNNNTSFSDKKTVPLKQISSFSL